MNVTRADRHRLEAIVSDRSAPQKHVWRANIILATIIAGVMVGFMAVSRFCLLPDKLRRPDLFPSRNTGPAHCFVMAPAARRG